MKKQPANMASSRTWLKGIQELNKAEKEMIRELVKLIFV